MPKLNRDSIEDAKYFVESILPENKARQTFINFLCDAITLADAIKSDNWNLNLDTNGKFLRFNTGHEYCIQLYKGELLVVCDRTSLKQIPDFKNLPITFLGFNGRHLVVNSKIERVPDLLVKSKNSIGCILQIDQIEINLYKFGNASKDFIRTAMNTRHPQIKQAHSKGAVEYILSEFREGDEQTLPDLPRSCSEDRRSSEMEDRTGAHPAKEDGLGLTLEL